MFLFCYVWVHAPVKCLGERTCDIYGSRTCEIVIVRMHARKTCKGTKNFSHTQTKSTKFLFLFFSSSVFFCFFFICCIRLFFLTIPLTPCLIIILFLPYYHSVLVLLSFCSCLMLNQFLPTDTIFPSFSLSILHFLLLFFLLFPFLFFTFPSLAPYMLQYITDT